MSSCYGKPPEKSKIYSSVCESQIKIILMIYFNERPWKYFNRFLACDLLSL